MRLAFLSVLLLTVFVACKKATPEFTFPQQIGDWKLAANKPENPTIEHTTRIEALVSKGATYRMNDAELIVEHHMMGSPAEALAAEQRWTPEPNTVVFHRWRSFIVLTWNEPAKDHVNGFVRDFTNILPTE